MEQADRWLEQVFIMVTSGDWRMILLGLVLGAGVLTYRLLWRRKR